MLNHDIYKPACPFIHKKSKVKPCRYNQGHESGAVQISQEPVHGSISWNFFTVGYNPLRLTGRREWERGAGGRGSRAEQRSRRTGAGDGCSKVRKRNKRGGGVLVTLCGSHLSEAKLEGLRGISGHSGERRRRWGSSNGGGSEGDGEGG
eukprot:767448-Hanusia_phi.AAC.1